MCLKYNLQEIPDCKLCDGTTRQQEVTMAPSHHTFLIDCETGVCLYLTGDPRRLTGRTSGSSHTPKVAISANRLRSCLTTCVRDQGLEIPGAEPITSASLLTDKSSAKPKAPTASVPAPAHRTRSGGQSKLGKALQGSLKQCLRRLASCVRTE